MTPPAYTKPEFYERMSDAQLIAAFNDLVKKIPAWLNALAANAKKLPATSPVYKEIAATLHDYNSVVKQAVTSALQAVGIQPKPATAMGFIPLVVPVLGYLTTAAAAFFARAAVKKLVILACVAMAAWIWRGQTASQKVSDELAAIDAQKKIAVAETDAKTALVSEMKKKGASQADIDKAVKAFDDERARAEKERNKSELEKFLGFDPKIAAGLGLTVWGVSKFL